MRGQDLAPPPPLPYRRQMEFDDQMRRYFGTEDLASATPAALEAGIERMLVDFGLEKDRSRRFGM